jgi:hypothetical protein
MAGPKFRYNPLTNKLDLSSDAGGGGSGNVTGPGSSVNNHIAVFNGVTGKIIKDGGFTIAQIAPLTTKGDIYGFSTVPARIPVGANGQSLVANSAQPLGVEWQDITNTPNAVNFNPGKLLTLVDDFICSYNGVAQDLSPTIYGQLNWDTFGGQWSAVNGTAANPGLLTPTNGAFASIALDNFNNSNSVQPASGAISATFVLNLVTLSAVANRYTINIGFGQSAGFTGNGISFQYADNVNSGNWQIKCTKSGVGTTTTNTSIAATTGYHSYTISINAAGTSVSFYIDGVLAGTIATANVPSAAMSATVAFARSSGALPLALFDLFYMTKDLTVSRSGGIIIPVASPTVSAYTQTPISYQVLITDSIVGVSSTASARTITMPNANMAIGQTWSIKDESLAAGTNNITISGNGVNIDGAATFVISNNGGAVDLYWNGTQFFIK